MELKTLRPKIVVQNIVGRRKRLSKELSTKLSETCGVSNGTQCIVETDGGSQLYGVARNGGTVTVTDTIWEMGDTLHMDAAEYSCCIVVSRASNMLTACTFLQ